MKKIIVIDPEKKFWKTLEKVVNKDACEVVFLENGKSLMEKLQKDNFDLIILNLELPDKNGFVYCNQIKKDAKFKNIPVIITSSEKTEEDFKQHKKLKVRAQEYLRKPISASTLKEAIKQFLPDVIVEKKSSPKSSPKKAQEDQHKIAVEDFDEENIDKLLDETFIGLIEEEPSASQFKTQPVENTNKSEEKINTLIDENINLKQQIKELQKGGSGDEKLKKENEELKKSLEEIQNELNRKKEEIKELNVQIIALQKEKGFFEKENRDILMNITTLQADFDEKLSQQEKLIESLKNEKQETEKELNTVKMSKQNIEAELNTLKSQKQTVEAELNMLKSQKQTVETELNAIKTEKQTIETELNNFKNQLLEKDKFLDSIQKENAELKEKISELNKKIENLTHQLTETNLEKNKISQQITEQTQMIETLQKDLSTSLETKKALEANIVQLKEESAKTKTELQNTLRESEILKAQLTEAEEKAKKLEEKISKILSKINELKEEAEK